MAEDISVKREIDNRIKNGIELLEKLLSQPKLFFSELKPSDIPGDIAGVYAIFDKESGEALYVGRTKNLRRRLYTNHLHGPRSNARLKKYLTEDESQTDICSIDDAKTYMKDKCYVQYIIEEDFWERGKIEGLFSYLLNVRYIHEEH